MLNVNTRQGSRCWTQDRLILSEDMAWLQWPYCLLNNVWAWSLVG